MPRYLSGRADSGRNAQPNHHKNRQKKPLVHPNVLNLTCRFVVPQEAYAALSQPDARIDPAKVLRVIAPSAECPICLHTALVPRMPLCGHAICLACLYSLKKHADSFACPVCGEPLAMQRLMPATFLNSDPRFVPQAEHDVVLRLMAKQGAEAAVPVEFASQGPQPGVELVDFVRVVVGSPLYVLQQTKSDLAALEAAQINERQLYGACEGFPEAIRDVCQRLNSIERVDAPEKPKGSKHPGGTLYFYQTGFETGSVHVLSSLDISVLKTEFGDYANFPPSLVVNVEHIQHLTLDADARKKMKYLAHVPSYSSIALIEANWRNVLSPATLKHHGKQLAQRRRNRRSQTARDDRNRAMADRMADLRLHAEVLETLPEEKPRNIDLGALPSLSSSTFVQEKPKDWRLETARREAEQILQGAYQTTRGRKRLVIFSNTSGPH